jgi:hypothetical protein
MKTLKQAVLEIKSIVFEEQNINIEDYLEGLAKQTGISYEDWIHVYNAVSIWKLDEEKGFFSRSNKKLWSNGENQLVEFYVENGLREVDSKTKRNKTKHGVFSELEEILIDRKEASISFQYYNKIKEKKEEKVSAPVVSKPKKEKVEIVEATKHEVQEADVAVMMASFINNADEIGVNITPFIKGLLDLSNKGVQNNQDQVEELQGQVGFYKKELENEQIKNVALQEQVAQLIVEFEKMKNEVEYFANLDGKQKLQQLHNYNKKLKFMVDKFGGVISVGIK